MFEPFGMHKLRVKTSRHFLQSRTPVAVKILRKVFLPGLGTHDCLDLFVVRLNLRAQGFEQLFGRVPYTAGKHALSRLDMYVVPSAHGFLAPGLRLTRYAGSGKTTEPLLVRPFVCREADVAVDAPDTVLRLQTFECRIELRQTGDILR